MHRLVDPPPEQHEEWHPEQCELDAEVDRARFGELLWEHRLLAPEVVDDALREEDERDAAVGGEGDDGQEDQAKPPIARGMSVRNFG